MSVGQESLQAAAIFVPSPSAALSATFDRVLPQIPETPVALATMHALERQVQLEPWSLRQFQDSLTGGHACWLMSLENSEKSATEPIGYAVMSSLVDEAELLTIGIQPAFQRQGWGKCLLDFVCWQARFQGMARLLLEVRVSNQAAQALYQSCGFVVCGRRREYYRTDCGREDALLMHRQI